MGVSRRHHFSLDMEEKHSLENVLDTGLWEEILVGTISAWMCKRNIQQTIILSISLLGEVPMGPACVRETYHRDILGIGLWEEFL